MPVDADACVQHTSGALRSNDLADLRYDLISPIAMRRLAETYHEGNLKYPPYNWERGLPISDVLNHALQHIYKYLEGDREEDHLAHAMWNLGAACHSEEMWPHLNTDLRRPGCLPPLPQPQPTPLPTHLECEVNFINPSTTKGAAENEQ